MWGRIGGMTSSTGPQSIPASQSRATVDYPGEDALVFDRRAVRRHRERAIGNRDNPLFAEVAARLADRLLDVRRRFPLALDFGTRSGECAVAVAASGRVGRLVLCDGSPYAFAHILRASPIAAVVADEELPPFAAGCLDLVTSSLALHWINDLPGVLAQLRRVLKPDGLFIAALFAGSTLRELREVLVEAEIAERGGVSPRISPLVDTAEASALLQRAGFSLPVVDIDTLTLTYTDAFALMRDLRAMGEANALRTRNRGFARRGMFLGAADRYAQRYSQADGRVRATFQVAFLTGWSPAPSQQQALPRGSAVTRLADALESDEVPAGEKAGASYDR